MVEPYFDGSHRSWAEGFAAHSSHEVSLLTHRGAFWKWRMHGAALTLANELGDLIAARGMRPDALIVSDMVDVSSFCGLARAAIGDAAVVAYFHENQLTYPLAPGAQPDLSYAMKNWMSMAAADDVWFNSEFHRTQMAGALPVLLGSMPDHRHSGLIDGVLARSLVMPVGIRTSNPDNRPAADPDGAPIVLWNSRWEYDKDPGRFFAAIDRAVDRGADFRLAIAGQNFRQEPSEFEEAHRRHANRLVHFGEADPATYERLLGRSHIVVSTARHEFFGIAVAEAVAAGCVPVVPNALAYPELLGDDHTHLLYDSDDDLDRRLDDALDTATGGDATSALAQSVRRRFSWPNVAARYDRRLEQLVSC